VRCVIKMASAKQIAWRKKFAKMAKAGKFRKKKSSTKSNPHGKSTVRIRAKKDYWIINGLINAGFVDWRQVEKYPKEEKKEVKALISKYRISPKYRVIKLLNADGTLEFEEKFHGK